MPSKKAHEFPANNKLLGKSFHKALRALRGKARKGFGVHWCTILLDTDALAGITKPARASMSVSIDTLMNAEARAGFAPKGP